MFLTAREMVAYSVQLMDVRVKDFILFLHGIRIK